METKDRIKAIIASTGLSQDRFAAAYGIPKNTVHNWCQGINEPPEYLIELIAKDVAARNTVQAAWVFNEYRDKAGTGHFELFADEHEAVIAAQDFWDNLGAVDRRKYITDAAADFSVGLYRLEYDEVGEEYLPDFGAGAIARRWSPLI